MLALANAVLGDIRLAVSPVPVSLYRPETVEVPFCWVRPPDSSAGRYGVMPSHRSGVLYVDVWAYSWAEVETIEGNLAFLGEWSVGSFENALGIHYRQGSATRVQEPDAMHSTLLYTVSYNDRRVMA